MGIETVQKRVGIRLDAPVLLVVRKQREQSMAWLDLCLTDFSLALPGVMVCFIITLLCGELLFDSPLLSSA